MIKNIIFDYGGVVGTDCDTILLDTLLKFGVGQSEYERLWNKHWDLLKVGAESVDALWDDIAPLVSADISDVIADYNSRIAANKEVLAICTQLKTKGYKLGMLANESKEWMVMKRKIANLESLFSPCFSSADIGFAKPDAQAFQKTLQAMGAQAAETLFIDNLQRNIDAARRMGLHVVLFEDAEQLRTTLSQLKII